MFRRETIIALRARHQAYRVASDILYPQVEAPAPPEPVIPLTLDSSVQYVPRAPLWERIANRLFLPLVAFAVFLAWATLVVVLRIWMP
jgi:hypothetical protein